MATWSLRQKWSHKNNCKWIPEIIILVYVWFYYMIQTCNTRNRTILERLTAILLHWSNAFCNECPRLTRKSITFKIWNQYCVDEGHTWTDSTIVNFHKKPNVCCHLFICFVFISMIAPGISYPHSKNSAFVNWFDRYRPFCFWRVDIFNVPLPPPGRSQTAGKFRAEGGSWSMVTIINGSHPTCSGCRSRALTGKGVVSSPIICYNRHWK